MNKKAYKRTYITVIKANAIVMNCLRFFSVSVQRSTWKIDMVHWYNIQLKIKKSTKYKSKKGFTWNILDDQNP